MWQEHDTKVQRLKARLKDATQRLEAVEQEIREMEAGWGGSPLGVNPAQYEHDWVQFGNASRARSRYLWLLFERDALKEMIRTLKRKLAEVGA
jgi:hypothetical protein